MMATLTIGSARSLPASASSAPRPRRSSRRRIRAALIRSTRAISPSSGAGSAWKVRCPAESSAYTPSRTSACTCTLRLSAAPKRCPMREATHAGRPRASGASAAPAADAPEIKVRPQEDAECAYRGGAWVRSRFDRQSRRRFAEFSSSRYSAESP